MRGLICHLLLVALVLGCDSKPAVEETPTPAIEKSGSGVVRGKVTFVGTAPVMKKIDNKICHGAKEIFEEDVIVSAGGGLKNAIVYVDGVRGPLDKTPAPAVLDQKDCQFRPHVVAVRVGQTLRLVNSEAEMHNVHGNPTKNVAFSRSFATKGSQEITFAKPEIMKVVCDVHPWMKAYIGVFESSYFAVTAEDGSFDIAGLPEGTYRLRVWHERFGDMQQQVKVETGPVDANFVYSLEAPQRAN